MAGKWPRASSRLGDVHRLCRSVLAVAMVSSSVGCHVPPSEPSAPPPEPSGAALVYVTPAEVVALRDGMNKNVLYRGATVRGADAFVTRDSRHVVIRTEQGGAVAVDLRTGSVRELPCPCATSAPVPGSAGTVLWMDGEAIMALELNSAAAEPREAVRVRLPAPVPEDGRQPASTLTPRLVAVTDAGYLLSRFDYRSAGSAVGNPDVLYLVDVDGGSTRLGTVASNTAADEFLPLPDGDDVLYASDEHVSNACSSTVLGVVSTESGALSIVETPPAECSVVISIWNASADTFVSIRHWAADLPEQQANSLLRYRGGTLEEVGADAVLESAAAGPFTATLAPAAGGSSCGKLTVTRDGATTATVTDVCRVLAAS